MKASREVSSAEILTPERIQRLAEEARGRFAVAINGKIQASSEPLELAEESRKRFLLPGVAYLIDAIYSIVNDAPPERVKDEYCITCTLEEIFKRAGVTSRDMRAHIRELVYPRDGVKVLAPALNWIDICRKVEGRPLYMRVPFIQTHQVLFEESPQLAGLMRGTRTPEEAGPREDIALIEFRIHAAAYTCLESLRDALEQAPIEGGYMVLPRAFSSKIDLIISGLIAQADAEEDRAHYGVRALRKYNPEIRTATIRAIEKWAAGRANREGPMRITGQELRADGLLPPQAHHRERRPEFVGGLFQVVRNLVLDGEAFEGASAVNREGDTILIT